jgi:hypothetical protein
MKNDMLVQYGSILSFFPSRMKSCPKTQHNFSTYIADKVYKKNLVLGKFDALIIKLVKKKNCKMYRVFFIVLFLLVQQCKICEYV